MQQALGDQWEQLPEPLRAHYQSRANVDVGALDIEYPRAMQPWLNLLHRVGALINRDDKAVPTTVEKRMQGSVQYWHRRTQFPDGRTVEFRSHWVHTGGNRIIEYVNPVLGLCMAVHVSEGKLYYEGKYFVLKLGKLRLPIPEWLLLGHTTIEEQGVDDTHFAMDFRLRHPLLGQICRYSGIFRTESLRQAWMAH